jgi:hypothetical protein
MSFDLTAHTAHEDSLLEGAGHIPGATDLPGPSMDEGFYDAWRVYAKIAVSFSFFVNGLGLISFSGPIHRKYRRGTGDGPHAQRRRGHSGTTGPRMGQGPRRRVEDED